jgi:hypothetical protein
MRRVIVLIVGIIAIIGGFYLYRSFTAPEAPTPLASVLGESKTQLDFPIYDLVSTNISPSTGEYVLNKSSVNSTDSAVFFTITTPTNTTIFVTQQARPSRLPVIQNSDSNTEVLKFETEIGSAMLGKESGEPRGILYTDSTLIIFSTTNPERFSEVEQVMRLFTKELN